MTPRVHLPTSAQQTAGLLDEIAVLGQTASLVAGGTLLLPEVTRCARRPDHLIDLHRAGMDAVSHDDGHIRIGAMVSYQQLLDHAEVARRLPLLHTMCRGVTGGITVRGQGTLGGSACAARPNSDLPAVLVHLDARMRIRGPEGAREVTAVDFFTGAFTTALSPTELLTEIVIAPSDDGWVHRYRKLKFAEGSWPILTVSYSAPDQHTGPASARITFGALSAVPVSFHVAADPPAAADQVAQQVRGLSETDLWADLLAPPWYRRRVAPALAASLINAPAIDTIEGHPHDDI